MILKIVAAAVLATSIGGAAYAQTTTATPNPGSENPNRVLANSELMGAYYTDDSMSTLRSADEVRASFDQMAPEDQTAMREECESALTGEPNVGGESPMIRELCEQVRQF